MPGLMLSAPEKYQIFVTDVLHGYKREANLTDLTVYGCGIEEHDRNLRAVLMNTRLREQELILN